MLAIVEQRPRVLNILEVCELFLDFRRQVVRRRTAFELRRAEARAHILEGFAVALDHLDAVIALIRAARTPDDARTGLMASFALTEIQAKASVPAEQRSPASSAKILDELRRSHPDRGPPGSLATRAHRRHHVAELTPPRRPRGPRRTQSRGGGRITTGPCDEYVAISITHTGYIKRTHRTYRRPAARGPGPGGDEDEGR